MTYPGTATPLRGLNPFAESERDVLFGRDRERDELARLLTAEGFRAGLLYGESGVGKTSLLRAGLVPHLRDHGVVAVPCEDIFHPEESFAYSIAAATGAARGDHEQPVQYLARVLQEAMAGQMYLFIVDETDSALRSEERVVHELAELFSRVVARSAGRARFLFACASERLHLFGQLEKRTGSLFPPSSRYELGRFQPDQAAQVLERTLVLAGGSGDAELARAVAAGLAQEGLILPADLQMAALGVVELGIGTPAQLHKLGGVRELESAWLRRVASLTGDERAALRLLAELAQPGVGTAPLPVATAAQAASVDGEFARHALSVMQDKGVTRAVTVHGFEGESELRYSLSHELLAYRAREVAAPARASARRAYELLGSKAAQNRRLTAREWYELKREGLAPASGAERAVLERTKRFAIMVAAIAAAIPLLLIIIVYVAMTGHYYLDASVGHGPNQRVVVRSGRAGLSPFHWLPPGFGDVVADTGVSRTMIDPARWDEIADQDLGGDRDDGEYVKQVLGALRPTLRSLIEYAATGSQASLDALIKSAKTPDEVAELLAELAPIARGLPGELTFVANGVLDPSPAVQSSALGLAAAAEKRRAGVYRGVLAQALAADQGELRRLAFAAARQLPDEGSQALYREALALDPDPAARRELLGLLTTDTGVAAPTASSALAVLAQKDASASARDKARAMLRRAFASAPAEAAAAAVKLIGDEEAPADDRVLALELLLELAPPETFGELVGPAKAAMASKKVAVQAAALPLYARVSPQDAAGDLALMLDNPALPVDLKVAMVLAWGEVAATRNKAAQGALETLVDDPNPRVRGAAARAYGYVGRPAQDKLIKMVKGERYDVSLGAAWGLANSAEAGGSAPNAVNGIYQLWKRKGKPKRDAARVYARMARTKPGAVSNYLASAAVSTEDEGLHPIAVEGLCNALVAGDKGAAGDLARAVRAGSVEVRRMIIECVSDNPKQLGATGRIAIDMADDADGQIRAEAARVLAALAGGAAKTSKEVGARLAQLAKDDNRDVRIIAIRALAAMGAAAPPSALEALPRAFENGDETERLVILRAARELGGGELVQMAAADPSPLVRMAAIETAIATKSGVGATLNSALSDLDPAVRRAAVEQLAGTGHGLGPDEVDRALTLAVRDENEALSVQALTTMARIGDPAQVAARLKKMFESPSERERARAAAAAQGLAERDAKAATALLEPLYDDPSRDVRAAMLRSLATAYASSRKPAELVDMLRDSESRPTRRLVVIGAFLLLAEDPATHDAAVAGLTKVVEDGPPLAKLNARLGLGLIDAAADGFSFLRRLVP
jgi:hypothetical protein